MATKHKADKINNPREQFGELFTKAVDAFTNGEHVYRFLVNKQFHGGRPSKEGYIEVLLRVPIEFVSRTSMEVKK